jgi:hypothetical protein
MKKPTRMIKNNNKNQPIVAQASDTPSDTHGHYLFPSFLDRESRQSRSPENLAFRVAGKLRSR